MSLKLDNKLYVHNKLFGYISEGKFVHSAARPTQGCDRGGNPAVDCSLAADKITHCGSDVPTMSTPAQLDNGVSNDYASTSSNNVPNVSLNSSVGSVSPEVTQTSETPQS